MSEKNSSRKQLENQRSLFFMSGLVAVLALIIFIIEWRTEQSQPRFSKQGQSNTAEVGIIIPRTFYKKPQSAAPRLNPNLHPDPKASDPDPNPNPDPEDPGWKPLELGGLDNIGSESDGEPDEKVEIVDAILVQNMARPSACAALLNKEEQMSCFNSWLRRYLAENVELPAQWLRFGHSETIYAEFVISQWGSIEKVEILRGEQNQLRQAASKALLNMPMLEPASQSGRPVRVKMIVPVRFNRP